MLTTNNWCTFVYITWRSFTGSTYIYCTLWNIYIVLKNIYNIYEVPWSTYILKLNVCIHIDVLVGSLFYKYQHNLCVKGISLVPWQHVMSRLFPATLVFQGYFRQHQGFKPFKDLKQNKIEMTLNLTFTMYQRFLEIQSLVG